MFDLENKKFWGDLVAAFQYLKGAYMKEVHFTGACRGRRSGSAFKLKEVRFRLDRKEKMFTMVVVRHSSFPGSREAPYPELLSRIGLGVSLVEGIPAHIRGIESN